MVIKHLEYQRQSPYKGSADRHVSISSLLNSIQLIVKEYPCRNYYCQEYPETNSRTFKYFFIRSRSLKVLTLLSNSRTFKGHSAVQHISTLFLCSLLARITAEQFSYCLENAIANPLPFSVFSLKSDIKICRFLADEYLFLSVQERMTRTNSPNHIMPHL